LQITAIQKQKELSYIANQVKSNWFLLTPKVIVFEISKPIPAY